MDSDELNSYVQALEVVPPEELLTEAMRSGAKLTQDGSYVMNYTANFAEGTRNVARGFALDFKNRLQEQIGTRQKERCQEIKNQLSGIEKYREAWEAIDRVAGIQREMIAVLEELAGAKEIGRASCRERV